MTGTKTRDIGNVTIASSGTTSGEFNAGKYVICGFKFPAMTGTSVTFTHCEESGGTFVPVADTSDTNLSITVSATAKTRVVNPQNFAGLEYIKLVSGSSEGADRVITVLGYEA